MRKGKAASHRPIFICASNLLVARPAHLLHLTDSVEPLTRMSAVILWSLSGKVTGRTGKRHDFLLSIAWIYQCWVPPIILFQSVSQTVSQCPSVTLQYIIFFYTPDNFVHLYVLLHWKDNHWFQFLFLNGLLIYVVILSIIPVAPKFLWESFWVTTQRPDRCHPDSAWSHCPALFQTDRFLNCFVGATLTLLQQT